MQFNAQLIWKLRTCFCYTIFMNCTRSVTLQHIRAGVDQIVINFVLNMPCSILLLIEWESWSEVIFLLLFIYSYNIRLITLIKGNCYSCMSTKRFSVFVIPDDVQKHLFYDHINIHSPLVSFSSQICHFMEERLSLTFLCVTNKTLSTSVAFSLFVCYLPLAQLWIKRAPFIVKHRVCMHLPVRPASITNWGCANYPIFFKRHFQMHFSDAFPWMKLCYF